MATASVNHQPTVLDEIEKLGFTANLVAQIDVRDIDRPIQVRESKHYSPTESKKQFAVQMTHSIFDPVVVTKDTPKRVLVDGHTRIDAKLSQKGGDHFLPAWVIDVEYARCTPKQKEDLHILAATLQNTSGVRLTGPENRKAAERMIKRGLRTEEIGRRLGIAPSTISQVKKEINAAERITRLGLNPNGDTRAVALRGLGEEMVLALTDAPYKELVILAQLADLNGNEIKDIAKEARATQSEAGAQEVIARVKGELADRIREKALTGHGKPPVSRQLRQRLGFITARSAEELTEKVLTVMPLHVQAVEDSIAILRDVLRLNKAMLEEAGLDA